MMLRISCITLSFIIFSILVRTQMHDFIHLFPLSELPRNFIKAFVAGYYDIIYALGLWTFFLSLSKLTNKRPRINKIVHLIFIIIIIISVLWGLVNFYAVQVLNSPINYQMLYYSDIMDSEYVWVAIAEKVSLVIICKILLVVILVLVGGTAIHRALQSRSRLDTSVKFVLLIGFVAYLLVFGRYIVELKKEHYDDYVKVSNPVIFFAKSFVQSLTSEGELFAEFESESHVSIQCAQKSENQKRDSVCSRIGAGGICCGIRGQLQGNSQFAKLPTGVVGIYRLLCSHA